MLKRRTNGVYTDVDDIKRKSNGSYVLCDFVKVQKNGVGVEVWPTKRAITPTAASTLGMYYHIYLKTVSADTLEAYIGEYTPASQSSGDAELMTTLSFSDLRTNKNLTFDCNIQVSGQYEHSMLVDNVVWWGSSSSSVNEKRSITTSNNSLTLGLRIKDRNTGYPAHADYIKATISNIRNGGQKFVWAYPQTIYETWPH